ncbi:hypothetical protein Taro_020313, partial [Colocasia esculenta]|nr:hypothetical protein [Colocasia esculenta]
LTLKRVKLLDMYGSQVAIGIVMSTDPTKIVMGKPIGQDFCEVVILLTNKPDSPLFIKDHNRKTMKDAIERHILWFLKYVCVPLVYTLNVCHVVLNFFLTLLCLSLCNWILRVKLVIMISILAICDVLLIHAHTSYPLDEQLWKVFGHVYNFNLSDETFLDVYFTFTFDVI